MANRMKALYNQVIFERRILLGCTALVGLSTCIWAVAIGTDHWYTIEAPNLKEGLPITDTDTSGTRFVYKHIGLWRKCVNSLKPKLENSTEMVPHRECIYHDMFPPETRIETDPTLDRTVLNYSRAQVSFALISLFVMTMGFAFSIYTFRNPRYMFKRLAGGIHFISAACNMVVIQVLLSTVEYKNKNGYFPKGSLMRYDFSLILAWVVFLCNLVAGFAFMIFSRKRKRDKAPTEEIAMADEPTIIGR